MFGVLGNFFWKQIENIFWRLWHYWQLNSLQNDVCFNHLGEKLWEKKDFLQWKVNFSGEGKNTSIWTMCKIYNVNNNKHCWYIIFLSLHWWNNIEIYKKKKIHPLLAHPLLLPICKIFNIHHRKTSDAKKNYFCMFFIIIYNLKAGKYFFNTPECLFILYTSCKTLHSVCLHFYWFRDKLLNELQYKSP